MTLQDAFELFRCFGVYREMMLSANFSAAYFRLASRYHPDVNPAMHELMANINAARTTILQSYRRLSWKEHRPAARDGGGSQKAPRRIARRRASFEHTLLHEDRQPQLQLIGRVAVASLKIESEINSGCRGAGPVLETRMGAATTRRNR
jgi:hypothetical protein